MLTREVMGLVRRKRIGRGGLGLGGMNGLTTISGGLLGRAVSRCRVLTFRSEDSCLSLWSRMLTYL